MLGTYHLNLLYDVLKEIHFIRDRERIYKHLLENLIKALDAEAASLFMADERRENLILSACIGPKKGMMEMVSEEMPFPVGKGICGWVAKFNQAVIVDDVKADARFNSQLDSLTGFKTKNSLCAPLSNTEDVLGVIEILNKKSSNFNKNDLDVVTMIAKQTAIALDNARLYNELSAAKNFNESVLSNLTSGFIAMNAKEVVTHVNSAAQKILELPPSGSVGSAASLVLMDCSSLYRELSQTLLSKTIRTRQETEFKRSDGSAVPVGYSTFLIQDGAGQILGAGIIFQDISSFKKNG